MKRLGKGCLIVVGVFILLGIIGAALSGGGNRTTSTASSAAGISGNMQPVTSAPAAEEQAPAEDQAAPKARPVPEPTAAPEAFTVGQDVQVDEVRWKILEAADLGQTLESDNQFIDDKSTSGRFVQVRFELENLSKDMLSFTGIDLQDADKRTFKPSTDMIGFIPEEQYCIFENLNPNVAKTCTAIYEVPANASGLQAKVGDLKLFGGAEALINLGLE